MRALRPLLYRWLTRFWLFMSLAGMACVTPVRPPATPGGDIPPVFAPATRALGVTVLSGDTALPGVSVTLDGQTVVTNGDGYAVWPEIKIGLKGKIEARKDGYQSGGMEVEVTTSTPDAWISLAPLVTPKPWELATDYQLFRWRGFISALLGDVPYGPRPSQPDNVIFSAEYTNPGYSADDRAKMRRIAKAKGYVHWPLNPMVSRGYHGRYPDADWRGDAEGYLDRVQELWDNGFIPVFFLLPDTGGDACADGQTIDRACVEARLTPLFTAPRFQALARIVILAWEPDYASADWQWGTAYMARVFPKAKRGIHFPSGHAAPCRGSELAEAGGTFKDEGACWWPVASQLHLVLQQNTFVFTGDDVAPGRTPEQQYLYNLWDTGRRLTDGYAGWPTVGADGPIRLVSFEWGSYTVTNTPSLLWKAEQWGTLALASPPFRDPVTGATVDAARYVTGVGDSFLSAPGLIAPFSTTPRLSAIR